MGGRESTAEVCRGFGGGGGCRALWRRSGGSGAWAVGRGAGGGPCTGIAARAPPQGTGPGRTRQRGAQGRGGRANAGHRAGGGGHLPRFAQTRVAAQRARVHDNPQTFPPTPPGGCKTGAGAADRPFARPTTGADSNVRSPPNAKRNATFQIGAGSGASCDADRALPHGTPRPRRSIPGGSALSWGPEGLPGAAVCTAPPPPPLPPQKGEAKKGLHTPHRLARWGNGGGGGPMVSAKRHCPAPSGGRSGGGGGGGGSGGCIRGEKRGGGVIGLAEPGFP